MRGLRLAVGLPLAVVLLAGSASAAEPRNPRRSAPTQPAGEIPPMFFNLAAGGSDGSVATMRCESVERSGHIRCKFIQTFVLTKTEDEIKAGLAKARKELEGAYATEWPKARGEMCDGLSKKLAEMRSAIASAPEARKRARAALADHMTALCACSTRTCVLEEFIRNEERELRACRVTVHTWEQEFERVSDRKWISNPGSVGLCNVVTVSVLEGEKDAPSLWTLTQTVVSADREGPCAGVGSTLNQPLVYSWKNGGGDLAMRCELLTFESD